MESKINRRGIKRIIDILNASEFTSKVRNDEREYIEKSCETLLSMQQRYDQYETETDTVPQNTDDKHYLADSIRKRMNLIEAQDKINGKDPYTWYLLKKYHTRFIAFNLYMPTLHIVSGEFAITRDYICDMLRASGIVDIISMNGIPPIFKDIANPPKIVVSHEIRVASIAFEVPY